MTTIQESIRERRAGAEEAKLKAKQGKKKKMQVKSLIRASNSTVLEFENNLWGRGTEKE
jgi:hypothetical protein